MNGLGIIAGGGDLPIAVAESANRAGRDVFIMGIKGSADEAISRFSHDWVAMGESRRALDLLRAHGCKDIILCGRVARPRFSDIRLDAKSVLLLPKVLVAARKGDDALLRAVVDIMDSEGFRVVGVAEAAPGLLAREGAYGRVSPHAGDFDDIAIGIKVVRRLGALDVGQAAAVNNGLVLAVEAAEGTDAMIARIASLPERIRGTPSSREGVLVKALKPVQDRKTDLPVIGAQTVRNVAAAGLHGIAVEAGAALVINEKAVAEVADSLGVFVFGFSSAAHDD